MRHLMKCNTCGKVGRAGNNVSHSKRRTKTRWLPNIHKTTMTIHGQPQKVFACTRCMRTQYKLPR